MKINNIKPNLRQFLTDKIKTQKINLQNVAISNKANNFIKQINSHNNSNKNIGKFSLLNSIKDKENKKIITSKNNNNNINTNEKNINYNFNNNSFYKDNQNDYNKFRKSKTSEKINGNIILAGYQQQNKNNKNKKIMIKQNTGKMKKYNLSISKIPKYDSSAFNQVIKYYTIKSESKTIQVEELSAYLRPIRNILGFANKIKTQNNISSSININSHYNNKKYIVNNTNNINKDKENSEEELEDINKNYKENYNGNNDNNNKDNINIDDNINNDNINNEEKNFKIINNEDMDKDTNDMTFGKNKNIQSDININENKDNEDKKELNNNINNNLNKINTSLIKNCVFNNISHTQRNNKFSPIPFNIKIDKINDINISNIKNISINNNIDKNNEIKTQNNTITNNIINSKNTSEIDTQISTNNNINNKQKESLAFYQFRPRKMNLPKTGINLSSLHFNNKILLNILNKKKQNK